MAYNSIKTYEL